MGVALTKAALELGHRVTVISGPVLVDYPEGATVVPVVTTDEMLQAAKSTFRECDGVIGAAAPCDYMPHAVRAQKISKTGQPLMIELIETPDVVASLGQCKRDDQWVVGFALQALLQSHKF